LLKLGEIKTVQGETVEIMMRKGRVFVNNAEVVMYDIQASNGIIHVLDSVLLPK
jgi:uncharacterized surface protein with fasciclin (FAS1) repeats